MFTRTFRDTEYKVKERLSLTEKVAFSDFVVGIITDMEELTYSPLYYDISVIQAFFIFYIDAAETPSVQEIDEHFNEYYNFIHKIKRFANFDQVSHESLIGDIERKIEFNKQLIIHKQKSSMDEAFESLDALLSTLNTKAEELDVKKLDKVLKKLNPSELMKAYQKSGISESQRDKIIQEQAKEIKDLKNEIAARNVKA